MGGGYSVFIVNGYPTDTDMACMALMWYRHLAIASNLGHVATFDWQAGTLHSEIQLKETVRDIKWVVFDVVSSYHLNHRRFVSLWDPDPSRFLQSESFYAVAQKKYVFIYDQNGVELQSVKIFPWFLSKPRADLLSVS